MREMGTRDRVLGDVQLVMPNEHRADNNVTSTDDDDTANEVMTPVAQVGSGVEGSGGDPVDILNDPLVDINKYRFSNRF